METTRNITLPSGGTCKVRRLTARDSLALGFFPDTLSEDGKPQSETAKKQAESQKTAVKMNEIILCDCTGKITRTDGTFYKITRKPFDECSAEEENVDLVATTEDGNFIVAQILEMSGFSLAAKEAVRPFPEESGSDGGLGQSVRSVSPTA